MQLHPKFHHSGEGNITLRTLSLGCNPIEEEGVHIYLRRHIHARTLALTHARTHALGHTHTHTHTHAHTCAHRHTQKHIYTHVHNAHVHSNTLQGRKTLRPCAHTSTNSNAPTHPPPRPPPLPHTHTYTRSHTHTHRTQGSSHNCRVQWRLANSLSSWWY